MYWTPYSFITYWDSIHLGLSDFLLIFGRISVIYAKKAFWLLLLFLSIDSLPIIFFQVIGKPVVRIKIPSDEELTKSGHFRHFQSINFSLLVSERAPSMHLEWLEVDISDQRWPEMQSSQIVTGFWNDDNSWHSQCNWPAFCGNVPDAHILVFLPSHMKLRSKHIFLEWLSSVKWNRDALYDVAKSIIQPRSSDQPISDLFAS